MKAIHSDEEGDILTVTFAQADNQKHTGIELSDNLVIYYNPETGQPLQLIMLSYQAMLEASAKTLNHARNRLMENATANTATNTTTNTEEMVTGQVTEPSSHRKGIEAFDDVKKLIIVAAHPDDLEVLCGGTIALLADRGVEIISVNCTLGDIGTQDRNFARQALATARLTETDDAAKILGIKAVHNLGRHDGELLPDLELRAQVAHLYRQTQADTLFTFDPFWPGQIHADHRAAGQVAIDAYMPAKMPLYRPEQLVEPGIELGCLERVFLFSTDRDPDIYVDITTIRARKIAACVAHKSQFTEGEAGLDWLREMDAEAGAQIGVAAGEIFKSLRVW